MASGDGVSKQIGALDGSFVAQQCNKINHFVVALYSNISDWCLDDRLLASFGFFVLVAAS